MRPDSLMRFLEIQRTTPGFLFCDWRLNQVTKVISGRSLARFFRLPPQLQAAKIDIVKAKIFFFTAIVTGVAAIAAQAQPTPRGQPDVSNKTLLTNANQDHVMGAAALHKLANDYY